MHAVLAIAVAAILAVAAPAHAQDWPQRPVTIVVPFVAGGSADLVARIFAQHFQAKYGVSVVVENRRRRWKHRDRGGGKGAPRRLHAAWAP